MASCIAYYALGSNLGDPLAQAVRAVASIAQLPQTRLEACSTFYRTKPLGNREQPDYLNAALKLTTTLTPEKLLQETQRIETQQGRERSDDRWQARTLDLDMLLYGSRWINSSSLVIPHYALYERDFFLLPLMEIEPTLMLPIGIPLKKMIEKVGWATKVLEPWS